MRIATGCLALLAVLAGSVPARAEVLDYRCFPACVKAPCGDELQFYTVLVGTEQRRILFPDAPSGSVIGSVIGRPDAVRTQLHVSAGEIAFEFWTKDQQGHGLMTIQRPSGRFAFSMHANGDTLDDMTGVCEMRPPPRRDALSRLHVPNLN